MSHLTKAIRINPRTTTRIDLDALPAEMAGFSDGCKYNWEDVAAFYADENSDDVRELDRDQILSDLVDLIRGIEKARNQ